MGLSAVWGVVCAAHAGRWERESRALDVTAPRFDPWQAGKGVSVLVLLVCVFLLTDWPREIAALAGAGVLLLSRRMHSREILALVDWQLLVLFAGLFIVNHALEQEGLFARATHWLAGAGADPARPAWLFCLTVLLSNVVSNVPAVMLLLPLATHPMAGAILALASTLAGNLLIVGSIANIIVVEQAARLGVRITWRDHLRIGGPVTLLTLLLAAAWLWVRAP
jgi:Na+/H+ antiporter NhaD/arsenite permease-like protein